MHWYAGAWGKIEPRKVQSRDQRRIDQLLERYRLETHDTVVIRYGGEGRPVPPASRQLRARTYPNVARRMA